MKRFLSLLLTIVMGIGLLTGCGSSNKNSVVIYSSDEDYINAYFQERLTEQFPDYDITIEYLPTGENAARLLAEGLDTPCDIVWGLEVGYLDNLTDNLADISQYDKDIYVKDMQIGGNKYLVAHRYSGCIVVNTDLLAEKQLPANSTNSLLLMLFHVSILLLKMVSAVWSLVLKV